MPYSFYILPIDGDAAELLHSFATMLQKCRIARLSCGITAILPSHLVVTLLCCHSAFPGKTSWQRSRLPVISIASDKGGPGKTTAAILLAAELALDGYRVTLIDTDLNQQAVAFGRKAEIAGLKVVGDVREDTILSALRKAEGESEIVLIDLPGGSSTLALKSMHRSHFVLVPTQASLPDIRATMKTLAQINDAQELARTPIARAVVWTRVLPGFESRAARHVRETVEAEGEVPILRTALMERAAYREMHITGKVPRQMSPESAAAANAAAFAAEILQHIAKLREAA
jgi:chromosome partitioning protein